MVADGCVILETGKLLWRVGQDLRVWCEALDDGGVQIPGWNLPVVVRALERSDWHARTVGPTGTLEHSDFERSVRLARWNGPTGASPGSHKPASGPERQLGSGKVIPHM